MLIIRIKVQVHSNPDFLQRLTFARNVLKTNELFWPGQDNVWPGIYYTNIYKYAKWLVLLQMFILYFWLNNIEVHRFAFAFSLSIHWRWHAQMSGRSSNNIYLWDAHTYICILKIVKYVMKYFTCTSNNHRHLMMTAKY